MGDPTLTCSDFLSTVTYNINVNIALKHLIRYLSASNNKVNLGASVFRAWDLQNTHPNHFITDVYGYMVWVV